MYLQFSILIFPPSLTVKPGSPSFIHILTSANLHTSLLGSPSAPCSCHKWQCQYHANIMGDHGDPVSNHSNQEDAQSWSLLQSNLHLELLGDTCGIRCRRPITLNVSCHMFPQDLQKHITPLSDLLYQNLNASICMWSTLPWRETILLLTKAHFYSSFYCSFPQAHCMYVSSTLLFCSCHSSTHLPYSTKSFCLLSFQKSLFWNLKSY